MLIKVQLDGLSFGPDRYFAIVKLNLAAVERQAQRALPLKLYILPADGKGEAISRNGYAPPFQFHSDFPLHRRPLLGFSLCRFILGSHDYLLTSSCSYRGMDIDH